MALPKIIRWTDCSIGFNIPNADLTSASKIKVTFKQDNRRLVIDGEGLEVLDRTHIRVNLTQRQSSLFTMLPPYATVDVNFIKQNGKRCLAYGTPETKISIHDNNYEEEIE